MAQQPTPTTFHKPAWLDCYDKNKIYTDEEKKKGIPEIEKRILYEYGAVYLSVVFEPRNSIKPPKCLLNELEVESFAESFNKLPNKPIFGNFYLQPEAKASLEKVFEKLNGYQNVARNCNTGRLMPDDKPTQILINKISSECVNGDDGRFKINIDWAWRDYKQTKDNWQLKEPIEVKEAVKDNYSTNNKPKMYSYAIPGSSQHHLGLAIDVIDGRNWSQDILFGQAFQNNQISTVEDLKNKTNPDRDAKTCNDDCVEILNQNGWYRTIRYDAYHFTYLGVIYSDKDKKGLETAENELKNLGLKKVRCNYTKEKQFEYWVPKATYKNEQNKDVPYESYKNWECKDV